MIEILLTLFVGTLVALAATIGLFSTISVNVVGICLTFIVATFAICLFMERFSYYKLNKIKEELAI
ncbi:hypothetical protein ACKC9G_04405 [Pokkaliibacter sp. CJK22405]